MIKKSTKTKRASAAKPERRRSTDASTIKFLTQAELRKLIIRLLIVGMFLFPSAALVWADNQAAYVDSLKEEAAQGDADAQFTLGVRYSRGRGVPQDYAEALKWYRLAANQGKAAAQLNLGVMYHEGEGVPRDYVQALKWYRLAAAQRDALAQYNLGAMSSKGEGVPRDYAEALKWFRLAAAQGHAKAQYNLGAMYGKGQGVPQNSVQALKWLTLAAATFTTEPEHGQAVQSRDIVAANMTPAQIAEAQKLAREWQKQ